MSVGKKSKLRPTKNQLTTTLEIIGLILLVVAAFQVNITLGLMAGGASLLFLGYALGN